MDSPNNDELDDHHQLNLLSRRLSELSGQVDREKVWPKASIEACAQAGVFRWFIPQKFGGWEWDELQILEGYLALSSSCLTTAFILTQWHAACRRILASSNEELCRLLATKLASGELFATVGISHLTTSRQHLAKPMLAATRIRDGYQLTGNSPWVTGAAAADILVVGASLQDGSQILAAVPAERAGVERHSEFQLLALTASCTGTVGMSAVQISQGEVLAGPVENVLQTAAGGGGAGGLQTSVLAVGLARSAVDYMLEQAHTRPSLQPVADKLHSEVDHLHSILKQLVEGRETCNASQIRRQANSLVLRATQAALQTAKGAGFVEGHPTGRWAREALFFLVWSCPQAVMDANLCDFAGLEVSL